MLVFEALALSLRYGAPIAVDAALLDEQGVVEAGMAYRGTSFARLAALDPIKTDTDSDLQLAPWVSCMQQLAGLQGFLLAPVAAASHFPHGRVVDPSSYRRRNRH